MINLILMLLGLAFPNNNTPAPVQDQSHNTQITTYSADVDTGGEEGQIPVK